MPSLPSFETIEDICKSNKLSANLDLMARLALTALILAFAAEAAANPATRQVPLDEHAFTHHTAGLEFEEIIRFRKGLVVFERLWVPSPVRASLGRFDGLGPLYNASACSRCHIRNGRASAPHDPRGLRQLVMRILVPGEDGVLSPDPIYGRQLQTAATPGHPPEAALQVAYVPSPVTMSDSTVVELRRPDYRLDDLAYGPMHAGAALSPRIAPPMIGLGLLEAIPADQILAHADPDDRDGDGISGRANILTEDANGAPVIGRFGWRASQPTVRDQAAAAFLDDIGMSTTLHPEPHGDCSAAQEECHRVVIGADVIEIEDRAMSVLDYFSRHVAVPERDAADETEFIKAGCTACHTPSFDLPGSEGPKTIRPYTDLLLHDMGDDLADGTGSEWRTAPLWGLGLTQTVNPDAGFLHDGRARTILEAVLWHGGEAAAARDAVIAMTAAERDALLAFLESL